MGNKREFLQRYPPDVLLLLDGSSDIHYGKIIKNFGYSVSIMHYLWIAANLSCENRYSDLSFDETISILPGNPLSEGITI
jgi:hypothetical protein